MIHRIGAECRLTRVFGARLLAPVMMFVAAGAAPDGAAAVGVPADARVCLPPAETGDGLIATFVDPGTISGPDTTANAIIALDTLPQQTATVSRIAFTLRDDSQRLFGPFGHDGGWFAVRFTGYIDIRVPGSYRFSANCDDGFRVLIGNVIVIEFNGAQFYRNTTGDAEFTAAGLYPVEVIFYDLQPCCNGIRLGALGPDGSGLMSLSGNPGFDFNADLGPAEFAGRNNPGPGLSIIPQDLYFTAVPETCIEPLAPVPVASTAGLGVLFALLGGAAAVVAGRHRRGLLPGPDSVH